MERKGGPGQEGMKRPLWLAGQEKEGREGAETQVLSLALAENWCWKAGMVKSGLGAIFPTVLRSALLDPCELMPHLCHLIKTHTFLHEPHI